MNIKRTTKKQTVLECGGCGYKWTPRQEVVVGCPKCKRGYYKARVQKRKEGSKG